MSAVDVKRLKGIYDVWLQAIDEFARTAEEIRENDNRYNPDLPVAPFMKLLEDTVDLGSAIYEAISEPESTRAVALALVKKATEGVAASFGNPTETIARTKIEDGLLRDGVIAKELELYANELLTIAVGRIGLSPNDKMDYREKIKMGASVLIVRTVNALAA